VPPLIGILAILIWGAIPGAFIQGAYLMNGGQASGMTWAVFIAAAVVICLVFGFFFLIRFGWASLICGVLTLLFATIAAAVASVYGYAVSCIIVELFCFLFSVSPTFLSMPGELLIDPGLTFMMAGMSCTPYLIVGLISLWVSIPAWNRRKVKKSRRVFISI